MQIILFTHPAFLPSQSMPLFANMIEQGMIERGHSVERWSPNPWFYRLPAPNGLKKWLGYLDQFLIFPLQVWWRLKKVSADTLFVFADQALGPWVPLVKNRPHAIHCHDFMALHSALGFYPQNPVSFTGKRYQAMIRRGFSQGRYFISVSEKTRSDLHHLLPFTPQLSECVYNGLNYPFTSMPTSEAVKCLQQYGWQAPENGFLLHIGGNQWYKNRKGVLHIYSAYCEQQEQPLPLLMIGSSPSEQLLEQAKQYRKTGNIKFLTGVSTEAIQAAYSLASALIFPSIAEGFGWPIAEAMACGCPALTTDAPPMTEVGGEAAVYLPAMPNDEDTSHWAHTCAQKLQEVINCNPEQHEAKRQAGFRQAQKFNADITLDKYEKIYSQITART